MSPARRLFSARRFASAATGRPWRAPREVDRGKMFEANRRNLAPTEALAREQASVAGDDVQVGVDEDGHVEAEGLDAVGDLTNLLGAMPSCVARIRFQTIQLNMIDRQRRSLRRRLRRQGINGHMICPRRRLRPRGANESASAEAGTGRCSRSTSESVEINDPPS
jgi:hypothetical protein